jgi:hypothetical protein
LTVQVQDVSGPDLGVGPGSDPDLTFIFTYLLVLVELKFCIIKFVTVFRKHGV